MDIIEDIRQRAATLNEKIVLPEATDERVLQAADFLQNEGICDVYLLGKEKDLRQKADSLELDLNDITFFNTLDSSWNEEFSDRLFERRQHKGISREEADERIQDSLYFGAAMVATGKADGAVAGSIATTGDVLRAALHLIGLREGSDVVSSIFLMAMPDGQVFTYGDCGVVPYPDANQLATIAIDSAETHRRLTEKEPNVAMLSFSTKGSARHERIKLVTDALDEVKTRNPELNIDGELQFDAALVEDVAKRKASGSSVAGKADVFIFPNLDAGNIGYKITERLGGAVATGPIIQGLDKPMMDLSRGCSWQDIVNAAAVCLLMS